MQHTKKINEKSKFEYLNDKELQEIEGGDDRNKLLNFVEELYDVWQRLMEK